MLNLAASHWPISKYESSWNLEWEVREWKRLTPPNANAKRVKDTLTHSPEHFFHVVQFDWYSNGIGSREKKVFQLWIFSYWNYFPAATSDLIMISISTISWILNWRSTNSFGGTRLERLILYTWMSSAKYLCLAAKHFNGFPPQSANYLFTDSPQMSIGRKCEAKYSVEWL